MDTFYYFHRWLLCLSMVVLMCECQDVSGFIRECPQGQLIHRQKSGGRIQYITCCYPTRCGVGEEVKACQINGTQDTCQSCTPHYNQSQRTSSFRMDRCKFWGLDDKCENIHRPEDKLDIDDWRVKRCMCDVELGVKFNPPEAIYSGIPADAYCQRMQIPCNEGYEPTVDGNCEPCDEGFFKAAKGFRLCEPKTDCSLLGLQFVFHGNSTADNNCSEPEPVITPNPHVTDKPTSAVVNPKPPSAASTSSSTTTSATTRSGAGDIRSGSSMGSEGGSDDDSLLWPIVGSVIFLVLVVTAILLVLFLTKCRGKAVCGCESKDPEKYATGSGDQRNKNVIGNGNIINPNLRSEDKVLNNNINGGPHYSQDRVLTSHPNGSIPTHAFGPGCLDSVDDQACYPQSTHQYQQPRQGILRSGQNRRPNQVVYGQARGNMPERSMDSIGREKLQVNVDTFEPNGEIGENDPLLVTESHRGAAAIHETQFQNLASSASNSPPVMPSAVNPMHFPASTASVVFGPTPNLNKSGHSSPLVYSPDVVPQVTCVPATGTVTYTRSTSVIASPEGEVDEEEIEAIVPRFSQLLPEGEDSSMVESNPNGHMFPDRNPLRTDSSGRETTQQLRDPSQRLLRYNSPPDVQNYTNAPIQHQSQLPQQRRPGNPLSPPLQQHQRPDQTPAGVGPIKPTGPPQESLPDHCIMNLKEQQLAESLHSSLDNSVSDTDLKQTSNHRDTDAFKTVTPTPEEIQQTELKTHMSPTTGASAFMKAPKTLDSDEFTTLQSANTKQVIDGNSSSERKRQTSGENTDQHTTAKKCAPSGNSTQNVSDRNRIPSGGSSSSGHSTSERRRVPSGDQQRSCIKTYSSDEGDVTAKKQRYNRTVSFEEEENAHTLNKQWGQSDNTSNSPHRLQGPLRSVSDPEQKGNGESGSGIELTDRKCVSPEYHNSSNASSKTSVNSDLSGADSNNSSPSRASSYRRTQSENAPCSGESPHKPPPRSMSEEKPQKMDRPIAKVKPMPASDNTINQLPVEVTDGHIIVAAAPPRNATDSEEGENEDSEPADFEEEDEENERRGRSAEDEEENGEE